MSQTEDLPVLMSLRVQGVANVARLAAALLSSQSEAKERVGALVERGLAERSSRSPTGFSLSEAGHHALEASLDEESMRGDPFLTDVYRRSFLPLNNEVKQAASDWQIRRHGGAEIGNDHSDPEYDHAVIRGLRVIHERASVVLKELEAKLPRFAPYRQRLQSCIQRLESGDKDALTAAFADSYHTVWFELHQDLLLTLGLERAE